MIGTPSCLDIGRAKVFAAFNALHTASYETPYSRDKARRLFDLRSLTSLGHNEGLILCRVVEGSTIETG